ncbi:hypothetical protein ACFQXA_31730 [Nocardiopsis composta]
MKVPFGFSSIISSTSPGLCTAIAPMVAISQQSPSEFWSMCSHFTGSSPSSVEP